MNMSRGTINQPKSAFLEDKKLVNDEDLTTGTHIS